MKFSSAASRNLQASAANNNTYEVKPAIWLERKAITKPIEGTYNTYKLRTNPTDTNSPTHNYSLSFFATGPPEDLLCFLNGLNRVIVGQNITNSPAKFSLARNVLLGDALAAFNRESANHATETNQAFLLSLQGLVKHVLPPYALANQKRYLRRHLRKPRTMKFQSFVSRVVEINNYLARFPPFSPNQVLSDDELVELIFYGMPKSWIAHFHKSNLDLATFDVSTLSAYGQRMETSEDIEVESVARLRHPKNARNGTTSNVGSTSDTYTAATSQAKPPARGYTHNKKIRNNQKFCVFHNQYGHDTGECKRVLDQAKKMRDNWLTKKVYGPRDQKPKRSPYKEMHAMLCAKVSKQMQGKSKGNSDSDEEMFATFKDMSNHE